jgi:hypothetical protein
MRDESTIDIRTARESAQIGRTGRTDIAAFGHTLFGGILEAKDASD